MAIQALFILMFKNYADIYSFFIEKRLSQMWVFLGIAILLALVGAPVPYIFGYLIDKVIPSGDTDSLLYIVVGLTFLMLLQVFISYINSVLTFKVRKEITIDVIQSLLHGIFTMPYEKRSSLHTGDLISRLTRDVNELYQILPFGIADLIYRLLFSALMLGVLVSLNWKLSAMLLVLLPIIILVYIFFNRALWELAFKDADASSENIKYLNEVISSDYEIKSYGAEGTFKQLAMKAVTFFQETHYQRLVINEKMNASVNLFPVIASTIIWYFASLMTIRGEMTIGLIVTYTTTISLIVPSLMRIVEHISEYPNQIAVFRRIQELSAEGNGTEIQQKKKIDSINYLHVKNVDFKYKTNKKKTFENFSYSFEKGKKYLIKAPNGFGKSTLFSLISKQLTPSSGEVYLDQTTLSSLDAIHQYITLLPQQVSIISDTIRNNLSFGDTSITDEKIIEMLVYVGLEDWFNEKDQDLDHVLSLSKQQLSGGQIQRIGLARAFLRNTPILLLDEPTNNLDNAAVHHLIQSLETLNSDTILLIISHDDRIYPHVDKVLNLSFE